MNSSNHEVIEKTFLESRAALLAFLRSRDASGDAEDILHEMWLRLRGREADAAPIGAPASYLYRMANSIIIDRHRQRRQASLRELQWAEAHDVDKDRSARPGVDREVEARQTISSIMALLDRESERARRVFWMHRIDGRPQREIAEQMRVSLSTVEGDLRKVYRVLAAARSLWDKATVE